MRLFEKYSTIIGMQDGINKKEKEGYALTSWQPVGMQRDGYPVYFLVCFTQLPEVQNTAEGMRCR